MARFFLTFALCCAGVFAQAQSAFDAWVQEFDARDTVTITWAAVTEDGAQRVFADFTVVIARDDAEATLRFGDLTVDALEDGADRVTIPEIVTFLATAQARPEAPRRVAGEVRSQGGSLVMREQEGRSSVDLAMASLALDMEATGAAQTDFTVRSDAITGQLSRGEGNLDVALGAAGLAIEGLTTAEAAPPLSLNFDAQAPSLTAAVAGRTADIGLAFTGFSFDTDLPGAPLPLALEAGLTTYAVTSAPGPEDGLQTTRVTADIADYGFDADLLAAIDPGEELGRAPGRATLDLTLETPWPDGAENFTQARELQPVPASPLSVTIKDTLLDISGLRVTLDGAWSNADTESVAEGRLDIDIDGLLNVLGVMTKNGAIEPTQAFGAQFVLGVFARPREGDDSFTIPVEFGPEGAVTVNGQRVR